MTQRIIQQNAQGRVIGQRCRRGLEAHNIIVTGEAAMRTDYARLYLDELAHDDEYADLYAGEKLMNLLVDEVDTISDEETEADEETSSPLPRHVGSARQRRHRDIRNHRWHYAPGDRPVPPRGNRCFTK